MMKLLLNLKVKMIDLRTWSSRRLGYGELTSSKIYALLSFLGGYYSLIKTYIVDAESILTILNEKKNINDKSNCVTLDNFQGNIVFKSLSFSYISDGLQILKQVSSMTGKGLRFWLWGYRCWEVLCRQANLPVVRRHKGLFS